MNKLAWLDELVKPMQNYQQPAPPDIDWLQRKKAEQLLIKDVKVMK